MNRRGFQLNPRELSTNTWLYIGSPFNHFRDLYFYRPFKFEINSSDEVKAFLSDLHKVSLAMSSQLDMMRSNLTKYAKNMQLDKMPHYLATTGYKLQQTSHLFNSLVMNTNRTIVAFYRFLESFQMLCRLVCVCLFVVTVFYLHRGTSESGEGTSEYIKTIRNYLTYFFVILTALSPLWIFGVRIFS
jgi:hypothetical protein